MLARAGRSRASRDGRIDRRRASRHHRHPRSEADPEDESLKTSYDPSANALDLDFSHEPIVESEAVRPGIIVELDDEGRVVGIEILDATMPTARGADLKALSDAA
ncbi:DUF2283 domain-containing protein [Methylobacterium sp. M6A4_1b]